MIHVDLIVLGRLKESYLREAAAEYEKRLQAFCKLRTIELAPYRLPDDPGDAHIRDALEREAVEIEKHIPPNAAVFALCIEGKTMSSEQFSAQIERAALDGCTVVFVIGSSFGLADRIKRRADVRLSMSPMTFPHQLARVMLLEQLYRAFQIAAGGKYHK